MLNESYFRDEYFCKSVAYVYRIKKSNMLRQLLGSLKLYREFYSNVVAPNTCFYQRINQPLEAFGGGIVVI